MRRFDPAPPAEADEFAKRQHALHTQITGLQIGMMIDAGTMDAEIDQHYKLAESIKERVESRQVGYVGWLATDSLFRHERDAFRAKWGAKIDREGGFPTVPMSYFGERPQSPPEAEQEFYDDYMTFFTEWGLETLATWELPVPMRPELTSPSLYHNPSLMDAGLFVFAPWYLLRDPGFDLNELARHRMQSGSARRLRPWMDGQPKNWSYDRYTVMFQLYVYLTLSIEQRYAGQLRGQIERLERAFTRFAYGTPGGSPEKVRKIRLELNARLRPAPEADS